MKRDLSEIRKRGAFLETHLITLRSSMNSKLNQGKIEDQVSPNLWRNSSFLIKDVVKFLLLTLTILSIVCWLSLDQVMTFYLKSLT